MALIWLTGSQGSPSPVWSPNIIAQLDRLLKPEGALYFELKGLDSFLGQRSIRAFSKHNFAPLRSVG